MNELSYILRNKPSWWTEFQDPTIRAQWVEETLQQPIRGGNLSRKEVETVLDELRDYAKMNADPTGILVRRCHFHSYFARTSAQMT